MPSYINILKDAFFLTTTLALGIFIFRKLSLPFRLIFLQIFLAFVVYVAAYLITYFQQLHGETLNNQWIFNVYLLLEVVLLVLAGSILIKSRKLNKFATIGMLIFLLIFSFQLVNGGFGALANYAFLIAGIVIIPIYMFALYERIVNNPNSWKDYPEIWLFIGLIVYYGCNSPYFGMIHYLQEYSPELNGKLFLLITDVLGNIRYFLATLSFFMFYKQFKSNAIIV